MNGIDDIVNALKNTTKTKEPQYPCTHCRNNLDCTYYPKCRAWVTWYTTMWRKIRKMFGKV